MWRNTLRPRIEFSPRADVPLLYQRTIALRLRQLRNFTRLTRLTLPSLRSLNWGPQTFALRFHCYHITLTRGKNDTWHRVPQPSYPSGSPAEVLCTWFVVKHIIYGNNCWANEDGRHLYPFVQQNRLRNDWPFPQHHITRSD